MKSIEKDLFEKKEKARSHVLVDRETIDPVHWKKRLLQRLWNLFDKGRGHQLGLLFVDIISCFAGMLSGWIFGVLVLGIKDPIKIYFSSIAILCISVMVLFYALNGYRPTYLRRQERELEIIIKSVTCGFLIIFTFNFMVLKSVGFSRYIYIYSYVFVMALVFLGRFGLKWFYRKFWQRGIGRERAIIVGNCSGKAQKLQQQLHIQQFSRFEIVSWINKKNGKLLFYDLEHDFTPAVNLERLLKEQKISTIFMDLDNYSKESHQFFLDLVEIYKKDNIQLFILSDIFKISRCVLEADDYVGFLRTKWAKSELEKRLPLFIKRALDITASAFLGIALSPLIIITAIAIKLQDWGPILYKRRVIGQNGMVFNALKFRTMIVDADEMLKKDKELKESYEKNCKLRNDSRITRLGKILRKLSIDELPQLYNVFLGQMSLVGPRMVTPEELERYGEFKLDRSKIKPGISGYWQVSGRQEVDYEERIQMDLFYIYRWSIWMDLWILLKTVQKVLKMEGAY